MWSPFTRNLLFKQPEQLSAYNYGLYLFTLYIEYFTWKTDGQKTHKFYLETRVKIYHKQFGFYVIILYI